MKKIITLSLALLAMLLLSPNVGRAAFPIKQETVVPVQQASESAPVVNKGLVKPELSKSKLVQKKSSGNTIPQGLYIVLAIFVLGWLGMGINDDFQGYDWLISLLLYIIFYVPGLVYTLIMMGKYY